MENINKLKRSEIDKNSCLKNKILEFININNIELNWVSNFKQIIYHYINNIDSIPKCYCGKFNNFKSSIVGYRKTCSPNCSNKSIDKISKTMNIKLEKYGDKNYNNPKKVKKTKVVNEEDEKAIENERRYILNSVIVRIAKGRKQIKHQELTTEIIRQVTHFKPQPPMIKSQIESLIQREFLARDEKDKDLYIYLP